MPEIKTSVTSKLHYVKTGAGPVAVLIHGFPESSTLWRYVQDELARKFTLLIPDLPGSGKSMLDRETGIDEMADCIAAILDHEVLDRAVIAGHSMGGYVALAFADRYPGRLAGLSLVHSTAYADDEEKKKTRLKSVELVQNGGKSQFIRHMINSLFANSFKQDNPAIVEEQLALTMDTPEESIANYQRAMIARPDRSSMLEGTVFPVQWIAGMEDNVIYYKKILEQCAKSGVNFVTFYSDCGHMSMLEAPAKLINDLVQFIDYCYERRQLPI